MANSDEPNSRGPRRLDRRALLIGAAAGAATFGIGRLLGVSVG